MTIKLKIFVGITLLTILTSVIIYFFSHHILLKNIETQEKRSLYHNIERVEKILHKEVAVLGSTCWDWASWDDTYNFVENRNEGFIQTYLTDANFSNLDVNVVIFTDIEGNILFSKTYGIDKDNTVDSLIHLKSAYNNTSYLFKNNSTYNKITGIVLLNNKPLLVSSTGVTKSGRRSGVNGTLVMGRFIDSERIRELEDLTNCRVKIGALSENEINTLKSDSSLKNNNYNFSTNIINSNTIEGKGTLKDLNGKNSILITLQSDRYVYNEGYESFRLFIFASIIFMVFILIVAIIIAQNLIISKLEKLSNFMVRVSDMNDITLRLEVEGNDEFSYLTRTTNLMLERIEAANLKLAENENRLTQVMEGSNDGYWDFNIPLKKIYISPKLVEMLDYNHNEKMDSFDILNKCLAQHELDIIYNFINDPINHVVDSFTKEHEIRTGSGEIKWLLCKGKVVERDYNGNPLRLAGIAADITEAKMYQQEVEYLSFHDFLTGLHNRTYLFKELERIDKVENFPLSIIMGDVNGLKLINDAFGHKAGDSYLVEVAKILKMTCDKNAIIARLGGDEFIIILNKTTEQQASNICKEIKHNCRNSTLKPVRPSISLGSITEYEPVSNIQELLEIAEDRMYDQKLLESKSARHSIIALMEHSLLETDFETREHTERLYVLARKMGKYLQLPNNTLNELYLLSKLHDIGKIAIPREILVKPGTLSQSEWEIIKKHSEIGYRMALSSHDLIKIADGILSHHEKWDGTGYPRGLKGEEIPLISRIIAIIDAYDVITHARPYKEAFTHEEAINEISRCSGTHFDPNLVEVFKKMFIEFNLE
jgi:diguanylate cyclase (GGDEF)-like protein/PAS domain S-box-containing protein